MLDSTWSEDTPLPHPHLDNFSPEETEAILAQFNFENKSLIELECKLNELEKSHTRFPGGCNASYDGLLCWPFTLPDSLAVLPCMSELNGIEYNTTQNASRWCHSNGTWDLYSDYTACRELETTGPEPEVELTTTIYLVGYSISLVILSIAIWIFAYFKDLRCLRNIIHTNLLCTYLLTDLMWILTLTFQMFVHTGMTSCILLIIFLHYFNMTIFFWMFVEGLYLYMLVVATFTGEKIKLRVYAIIGWGCPIIFVVLWVFVKSFAPDDEITNVKNGEILWTSCPWMRPHTYDWIYKAPAIGVLLANFIFLIVIMWVLITKLRSAQSDETQQYRKAAKALLVLIPLLGITYIITIAGPSQGVYKNIYDNFRAVLLSTQGLTVALLYCFINTEVRNTLKHHLERWKTKRSFHGSRRYNYSTHSKEWSPRSRTESIRLYSQPTNNNRKRESTVSEMTTTTLVNINGSSRVSGISQMRSPLLRPSTEAENTV